MMKLALAAVLLLTAMVVVAMKDKVMEAVNAPMLMNFQAGRHRRAASCGAPTNFDSNLAGQAVYYHNLCRSQEPAANMKALVWDDELARVAQNLTNTCVWGHDMLYDCSGNLLGQNLYALASNSSNVTLNVSAAVTGWCNEQKDYNKTTGVCSPGKVCGHYTQNVWANTGKVGCGVTWCPNMKLAGTTWKYAVYVACNYKTPGNYVGQMPYINGPPCSQCGSTGTTATYQCMNNLCTACPAADGTACKCPLEQKCLNGGTWSTSLCKCVCTSQFYGTACESGCTCADTDVNCAAFISLCNNPSYRTYMQQSCQKTCNFPCTLPASCST